MHGHHSIYGAYKSFSGRSKGLPLSSRLDVKKAAGPGQINNWIYRKTADTIAPILTNIFQHTLDTGTIPADWKHANVTPIYKKRQTTGQSA